MGNFVDTVLSTFASYDYTDLVISPENYETDLEELYQDFQKGEHSRVASEYIGFLVGLGEENPDETTWQDLAILYDFSDGKNEPPPDARLEMYIKPIEDGFQIGYTGSQTIGVVEGDDPSIAVKWFAKNLAGRLDVAMNSVGIVT